MEWVFLWLIPTGSSLAWNNLKCALPDTDSVYPEWRHRVVEHAVAGKKTHDAHLVASLKIHAITQLRFNSWNFSPYSGITVIQPQDVAAQISIEGRD